MILISNIFLKTIFHALADTDLKIDVGQRHDIASLNRHGDIGQKIALVQLRTIRRMLVNDAPSCVGLVDELGMNAGNIHVTLEQLLIWSLATANNGTIDTQSGFGQMMGDMN